MRSGMNDTVVQFDHVSKLYGKSVGLDNVTLSVEAGAIFGFLGPNGAGKTTAISMMVDLIRPTKGKIQIFGSDSRIASVDIHRRIGFLSGDMPLDGNLTGRQQLQYFASLRGGVSVESVEALAKRLGCNLDKKIRTLSRGNRQKVGLISALMHDPELLLLDEPTTGLDPLVQAEFNQIILEHQKKGKTAFISSHILSEIQEICDHVAFIREGAVIAVEHMSTITAAAPKHITVRGGSKELLRKLKALAGVEVHAESSERVDATFKGDINQLLKLVSHFTVKDVAIREADLETIFMKYYEDK